MKRIKAIKRKIFAAALIAALVPVSASAQINLYVNDKPVSCDVIMQNDTTYAPIRALSEALGADVEWNGSDRSVSVSLDEETIVPRIIQELSPSVVAIAGNYRPSGMSSEALAYNESYAFGTGVVIKSAGMILTNAHVVDNITNITVIFNDGQSYAGTVQYADETSDLAVVKINKLGLKPVEFADMDDVAVGSTAIAIGTPISLSYMNSATKGIVSGKDVSVKGEYYDFIQTDATTNGGNSGGPLVNLEGKVIGINTMKYVGNVEGMSFSIPADTVQYVLAQFEKYQTVNRPDIGAEFTESWEAGIGLPTNKGLTVKSSQNPALLEGDTVKAVNGVYVHSIIEWNEAVKDTYTEGAMSVIIERGGVESTIEVSPI